MATIIETSTRECFATRAAEVMGDLRDAFLGLMEGLPGPIHRAADLERALGLSRTLGWQIHRVATSPSPLAAAQHVPGIGAVRHALRRARKSGVEEARLERAARAMDAFESLVEQHAGDRASFITMVNSFAGQEAQTIDLKTRRQAFRVMSQLWGVQVKTYVATTIMHPGRDSTVYDLVMLPGLHEIRRLRPGAPFRVTSQHVLDASEQPTESHALDDSSPHAPPGLNLLREFCTQPYPELETRVDGECMHTFLRETPLGNDGIQSIYLANRTRGITWKIANEPPTHIRSATITKPIQTLVMDTLIHRGMFGKLEPQSRVLGSLDRLGETDSCKFRPDETLPIEAPIYNLGVGLGSVATPHVPRYRHILETVCRQAGWNASEFEVFRCLIEYPVLSTTVQIRCDLPDEVNW